MAYKFGQFRKEQYSNYINSLNGTLSIGTTTSFGVDFNDIILTKEGNFSISDGSLFLRFSVQKFDRDTNVTIKLINNDTSALSTTNVQVISTIIVPKVDYEGDDSWVTYDIIITPNENYEKLIFAINRDSTDFSVPRQWVLEPAASFKIEKFGTITNIITTLGSNNDPVVRLKQIGVQSYPGLEMCINGEMVRVGRSGIYEINYGIDVTFIGFIPKDDSENDGTLRNHFILDYQY